MLDVKWQEHITNETIKQKTKIPDLMDIILRLKWKWAGHIVRMTDNWAKDLTMWHPQAKESLVDQEKDGLKKLKNPMETTGTTSQLIVKKGAVWRRPSSSSGEQQADNEMILCLT